MPTASLWVVLRETVLRLTESPNEKMSCLLFRAWCLRLDALLLCGAVHVRLWFHGGSHRWWSDSGGQAEDGAHRVHVSSAEEPGSATFKSETTRGSANEEHKPLSDPRQILDVMCSRVEVCFDEVMFSLSVVLVLVCSLQNVTLSAPNRRAFKVSRRHV